MTALKKRAGYRKAFDDFDAKKIARYSDKKIEKLLQDPAIVRNRLKVTGAVNNAQRWTVTATRNYGVSAWMESDGGLTAPASHSRSRRS